MARARVLFMIAPLAAAILQACSSGDSTPPATDASDASADGTAPGVDAAPEASGADVTVDSSSKDGTVSDANGDADAGSQPVDSGPDGDGAVVCPTPQYTAVSTFTSIFDGWQVAMNSSADLLPGPDGGGGTILELDTTVGSPPTPPGSAKLTIPFSMPGDQLLFAKLYSVPVNLTGTTVTAQIKLDSGLNTSPANPGQAFLVLKSTAAYTYAPANPVYLDSSAGFVTLTLDSDSFNATTPFYTSCDIREIDVVIQTGNQGTYTTAVVHIDTIAINSKTGNDAGPGDGGASDAPSDAVSTDAPAASDASPDSGD